MKNEVAVASMLILTAITCFAAWQVYRVADALQPIIHAVELVKSIPFLN